MKWRKKMKRPTETNGDWEKYAEYLEGMLKEWDTYGIRVVKQCVTRECSVSNPCLLCRTREWKKKNFRGI